MSADREKLLNLPDPVSALIGVFIVLEAATALAPEWFAEALYETFAFIPARLTAKVDPQAVMAALAALGREATRADIDLLFSSGAGVYATPLTYAFLHGGWTHLFVNTLTLAAFGAPVARRFGAPVFFLFFACCAMAGALTHLLAHPTDLAPVVGASAGISGTMAAIARFAFAPGAALGEGARGAVEEDPEPLDRLGGNRPALVFLLAWFGINLLMGVFPEAAGASGAIAWEAHIGGFVFGLVFFSAFDRAARGLRRRQR